MAQNIKPQMVQPVAAPQHYTPPTARELRAQTVHRLQIGLAGLAAMLLIVALANIIMNRARLNEAESGVGPNAAKMAETKEANDPLADIGVAPAADPTETTAEKSAIP